MQVDSWDPSDCVRLLLADGAWESLSKKAPGPGQQLGRRLTPERLAAQAGNKRLARLLREAKKKGAGWATVPAAVGEMLSKEERNARLPELSAQRPTESREAKERLETAPAPMVAEGAQQEQAEKRAESPEAVASSGATASCPPLTKAAAPSDTAPESPKAAAAAAAATAAATTSDEQEVVDDDFIRRVAREAIMKKIQELYGKD